MKKIKFFIIAFSLISLAACGSLPDWLGSSDKKKLEGDRVAVMAGEVTITPNDELKNESVDIPNASDASSSGYSSGNFVIAGDLSQVEKVDGGDASEEEFFLTSPPVVADNVIYAIDGHSNIAAYDAETLQQKWVKKTTASKYNRNLPGGGVAVASGVVYATTGYGEVLALSATDGKTIWKKKLGAPIRRAPVIGNDKVFAVTIDNQLFALSVGDGTTLWRHSGANTSTSIYGSANAAVKNDVVIAAYSSGEVFGINAPRGNELWTELVSLSANHESAASDLNDVTASPIIIDGIVYIGGNSGDLDAFNAANGGHIWQQKLGPITTTPWVAGKYIYVIAQSNKLVAINRLDGRIKWVSELPTNKKIEKRDFYSGPIMGGAKLLVVGSKGKILEIEPEDGRIRRWIKIPAGIFSVPVIANGKLYMLNRDAELVQVK